MIFKELDGGLSVIDNLKVAGAKEGKYGVAVIVSENSDASAVFTSNKIVAALDRRARVPSWHKRRHGSVCSYCFP